MGRTSLKNGSPAADHPVMALLDLDERSSDGSVVTLLWDPERDQVVLRYVDLRTGDSFVVDVPNEEALSAFHHPHVYRPQRVAAA